MIARIGQEEKKSSRNSGVDCESVVSIADGIVKGMYEIW